MPNKPKKEKEPTKNKTGNGKNGGKENSDSGDETILKMAVLAGWCLALWYNGWLSYCEAVQWRFLYKSTRTPNMAARL
ncbi:hypothetical protein C0J52_00702 [Blattella germanica]|nr:hypothetical protein C0J52_00702 [Blattella germanica]